MITVKLFHIRNFVLFKICFFWIKKKILKNFIMSGNLYFQIVIYYWFIIVLQDFLPQKI